MAPPKPTRAEQLRRHREIFEYARAHDLTLRDAETALARERDLAARARLAARRRCGRVVDDRAQVERAAERQPLGPARADAPWMMRD
jgi:hypothetical protein